MVTSLLELSEVAITWRTPGVIAGRARDERGIVDVAWTVSTGWRCSCAGELCAHVAAVRRLTDPAKVDELEAQRGEPEWVVADLAELVAAERPLEARDWRPWTLYAGASVLELPGRYEVDLERCRDSAEVLDWIVQVAGKSWATAEIVAGLVRALDDVLRLQSSICGSGVSHRISRTAIRRRVRALSAGIAEVTS